MSECAFCKIINKQANANIIFESENIEAFLDIDPINEGHVLIVPKIHEASVHKIPLTVLFEIMELAQRIVEAPEQIYDMDGYTIMQNGGKFCDFGIAMFMYFQDTKRMDLVGNIRWANLSVQRKWLQK